MPQAYFDILLEQPLILSQHAASAGAHQCLDLIPGSTLLGLAAGRLYAQLSQDSAWALFHSGKVRFGDALPLDPSGCIAYPVPLNWHTYKGERARDTGDRLRADAVFDPARFDTDPQRQPVQMRGGYVSNNGRVVQPELESTLKTAIDPDTGMAAESQLFGYQALRAGQVFRVRIDADDDVSSQDWECLLAHLAGPARFGRSRSAQFGRVRIVTTPASACPDTSHHPNTAVSANNTELTLWLLSDLALERHGQPCLEPDPALLGLPEGTFWEVNSSFLRTRRYSPYNAYRRHHDSERQVIVRGSVLRYRLPRALTAEELARLNNGVGLHIESGLGRVWVNPPLLSHAQPVFMDDVPVTADHQAAPLVPAAQPRPAGSTLLDVLERRVARRNGGSVAETAARALYAELCERIREARRFAALATNVPLESAPGRSQWGRLKQLASDLRHPHEQDTLWRQLCTAENAILRERSGWDTRYGPEPDQQLHVWMRQRLQPLHGNVSVDLASVIGHLAVLGLQPHWQRCVSGAEQTASQENAA